MKARKKEPIAVSVPWVKAVGLVGRGAGSSRTSLGTVGEDEQSDMELWGGSAGRCARWGLVAVLSHC